MTDFMPLNRVGYAFWSLILQCVADDQKGEIVRVLCVHMFAIFAFSILSFLPVTTHVTMLRPTPFYYPLNLLTVPFV